MAAAITRYLETKNYTSASRKSDRVDYDARCTETATLDHASSHDAVKIDLNYERAFCRTVARL